jgi:hypothetical protein
MQSISKQSNTFGFSLPGSVLRHSLGFPGLSLGVGRKYRQDYDQQFDRTSAVMLGVWFHRIYREACRVSRPLKSLKEAEDVDAHGRIAALEEKADQHDCAIAVLQSKLKQLSTDIGRLVGEVSTLRSAAMEMRTLSGDVSGLKEQIAAGLRERVVEQLSTKFDELREKVSILWKFPAVPRFDSRIISDFPEIFAEFRGKHFEILWRGSRDGFKAKEFHGRCDGHANTLTVILDTKGNIFGGFTPVEWESGDKYKADDSLESFLFTLKNPHNISGRRFALTAKEKQQAIFCDSRRGPCFGILAHEEKDFQCRRDSRQDPHFGDMTVSDNCHTNTHRSSSIGTCYTNDTGMAGDIICAGSRNFQVKEIEVFEITD